MAVRIRMKKMGRTHRPFYRICAMDSRKPRGGRVIEELGTYDPMLADTDARAVLRCERIDYWLGVGAQPTEKVGVLIKKYGTGGTRVAEQAVAIEKMAGPKVIPHPGEPAYVPEPEAPPAPAEPAAEAAPEAVAAPAEEAAAEPVADEAPAADETASADAAVEETPTETPEVAAPEAAAAEGEAAETTAETPAETQETKEEKSE